MPRSVNHQVSTKAKQDPEGASVARSDRILCVPLQVSIGARQGTIAITCEVLHGRLPPALPEVRQGLGSRHLPDALDHASFVLAKWAPGVPEERRFLFGIKVHADDGIPLAAYRCPGCGYVEFYARPA